MLPAPILYVCKPQLTQASLFSKKEKGLRQSELVASIQDDLVSAIARNKEVWIGNDKVVMTINAIVLPLDGKPFLLPLKLSLYLIPTTLC